MYYYLKIMLVLIFALGATASSGDTIRVLGDHKYHPIEYLEDGEIRGMFQDFVAALRDEISVPIDYQLTDWKEAQLRVRSGDADVLTVFSDKGDRALYYDFTEPFFVVHFNIFVRADDIFITELEDLHGSVVGVTGGGFAKETLKDVKGIVLKDIKSNQEALDMLVNGEIRAVAASKWVASYTISQNNIRNIKMLEPPFNTHAVSMGVRKGDTTTLNHLNIAIKKLKNNGVIDQILSKWSKKQVVYMTREDVQRYYQWGIGTAILVVIVWLLISQIILRKQVALKTTELSVALEEAKAGIKAKSQFLATMSHEIRTPMSGVLGMLDLLRDATLTDEEVEYLETAYVSGENLLTIINDILDFSKVEAGKMSLESIPLNLNELVEDVARVAAQTVNGKPVEIILDVDFDIPQQIMGDPTRLRQVILNLMSNAIKFTHEGYVLLRVVRKEINGEYVLDISVTDTGIGIKDSVKDFVFQSFAQADSTITRRFSGTGLGLAISKELVQLMGGNLDYTSVYGEGSTFGFAFPMTLPEKITAVNSDVVTDVLAGKKVLVVDDNELSRSVLEKVLMHHGMRVVVATDATEALERINAEHESDVCDLIITDMSMPGMSGFELAAVLHHKGVKVPILLLTSLSMNINPETARDRGVSTVLTKPIRRQILLKTIVEMFSCDLTVEPEKPSSEQEHRSEHILVAEDNVFNQNVFKKMLSKFGFSVTIVGDGGEAVAAVEKTHYDLILMDLQMPVLDGISASGIIRSNGVHNNKSIPIIALTANVLPEDKEQCLKAGMNDFLSKPVKIESFRKMIDKWLDQSQNSSS